MSSYPPPPSLDDAQPQTQQLHRDVDAAWDEARWLHPDGPTVQVDLLGSAAMVAWQETKAQRVALGEQCWSTLPPVYARYGTHHGNRLIGQITQIEQARGVVLTDSGMQAVALTFEALLRPGHHAVIARQVYNKCKTLLTWLADRIGLELSILDATDAHSVVGALRPHTRLVFVETFTNPLMRAFDPTVGAAVAAARRGSDQVFLVVDNTIATPWGIKVPLLTFAGIDVVVNAGTKAIAGQDRDMLGYVAAKDVSFLNAVMDLQAMRGGGSSWRVAQAVSERLDAARQDHLARCATAARVARWLQGRPQVLEVFHPACAGHPDAAVLQAHYTLGGSLISLRLQGADEDATRHFCDVLAMTKVFRYALSFDGWTSKVNHHQSVSEYQTPPGVLRKQGHDRLVRLAIGLEAPADLERALDWALNNAPNVSPEAVRAWQEQRAARQERV